MMFLGSDTGEQDQGMGRGGRKSRKKRQPVKGCDELATAVKTSAWGQKTLYGGL